MRKLKSIFIVLAACFVLASCATTGNVSNVSNASTFVVETKTFEEWSAGIKASNPYKRVENPTKPMELYTNAQADRWEVNYSKGWLSKPYHKNKTFDDYLAKQWKTCIYNPEWQKSEAGQKWIQQQQKWAEYKAKTDARKSEAQAELEAKARAEAEEALKKARPLTKEQMEYRSMKILMEEPKEIEIQ